MEKKIISYTQPKNNQWADWPQQYNSLTQQKQLHKIYTNMSGKLNQHSGDTECKYITCDACQHWNYFLL